MADRLDPKKLTYLMKDKKTAADATRELGIPPSTISRHMTGEPVATRLINRYANWLGVRPDALMEDDPEQYPQIGGLQPNNQRAHLPAVRGALPAMAPVIGVIMRNRFLPRELMNGLIEEGARAHSAPLNQTYPQLNHFVFRMGETFNDGRDRIDAGMIVFCVDATDLPLEKDALYVVERVDEHEQVNFSIRRARPFRDHAELSDGKSMITVPEEGTTVIALVTFYGNEPKR